MVARRKSDLDNFPFADKQGKGGELTMTSMKRVLAVVAAVAVLATTVYGMEPPARLPTGMAIHVAMRSPDATAGSLAQFIAAAARGDQ